MSAYRGRHAVIRRICPACGKNIVVTRQGWLRQHKGLDPDRWECDQKPMSAEAPAPAGCKHCGHLLRGARRCTCTGAVIERSGLNAPEPAPVGSGVPVWPEVIADWTAQVEHARDVRGTAARVQRYVIADMLERDRAGAAKYGTPLCSHNGRRALVDAYQEALDLRVYLEQARMEGHIEKDCDLLCASDAMLLGLRTLLVQP